MKWECKKKSNLETNGNKQTKKLPKRRAPQPRQHAHIFSWQLDHLHLILPNVVT